MRFIFAFALLLISLNARAAPSIPNDCWFGVMTPDKATQGQLVATGPVLQWRTGMSLVVYPTKESADQVDALMKSGRTPSYDLSRPITVFPTWITGPEPGDKNSDEEKSIEVTLHYRTSQGGSGIMLLTYWTIISDPEKTSSVDQQASMLETNKELHDGVCRGIP